MLYEMEFFMTFESDVGGREGEKEKERERFVTKFLYLPPRLDFLWSATITIIRHH